ncbi:hypothetical protein Cch01nite_27050 [Cellulomonas chitinilytica]|uniref:DinB family protein n=1 Tax=Cellulomonas chitinilytica TaxID=398759 RepID=A0A919U238_9CELL|nr:DinB family protein [Cellulomonas chitinilytica]GIG21981.1 hypothetical protein Cch01nite_27050 [Cellulomonas chitinilytica]
MDEKETLHQYLRIRRDDLLRKLDGLGEYDVRRPMTPTGTNLLGLVKHVASVQVGYFGETFGRPSDVVLPWQVEGGDPDGDMWVTAAETRDDVLDLWRRSCEHSDATIDALPLDAVGHVAWWPPEREQVTLHQILVHMVVEVARHAGHADIVRESIDGSVGNGPGDPNIPGRTADDWAAYCARIDAAAREAAGAA